MNMMAVPFHGNSLYVVNHNGEPYEDNTKSCKLAKCK